ncbi:Signal transduction histidine kinase [Kaistia soli DSM 19436]|uniref:histidine kinase n=1 Tax=Kaistia soli DSM 19436 TaxID=1122133 RepID=A0A1M5E3S3_9HYPH|nr:HAMP domain-containing sensor histidine kinase [Kaistia soli]SHF73899.1 Signal transduction histidine kinase [Kaistia soli DSM 19436]
MSILPRSLGGRLLVGGAIFMVLALAAATILIGLILDRFIVGQIDQRLDLEIATVSGAITSGPDGRVNLRPFAEVPPFDRVGSGWYWQVNGEGVDFRSSSLAGGTLGLPPRPVDPPPPAEPRQPGEPHHPDGPPPPNAVSAAGEELHVRTRSILVGTTPLVITAAAPLSAIATPLREALVPLVISIFAIAAGLLAASFMQVRIGLRPLAKLSEDLRAVRAGRMQRAPAEQPAELVPVVAELNALIDQNAAGLASARLHVANLAHSLKTPLAGLALELAEPGRDPNGAMAPLVEQMERGIRHHLGRARAAAAGGAGMAATFLAPRVVDLVAALAKIHADRNIAVKIDIAGEIGVACEGQDVDEMLGNLLDNAFQWARSTVAVSASEEARRVVLTIRDDGPGLPEALLQDVLLPGRRTDETTPGHGFGLSITRELAELYGGSLTLSRNAPRGLRVALTLPAAIG